MAGKVFFSVSMSLDGFIAPEFMEGLIAPEERRDDPDVQRWMAQWMELQQWIFPQRFFRENLKLGEGGKEGRDNEIVRETSSAPARASWASACSTSASRRGRRRRRSTRWSSS